MEKKSTNSKQETQERKQFTSWWKSKHKNRQEATNSVTNNWIRESKKCVQKNVDKWIGDKYTIDQKIWKKEGGWQRH